MNRTQIIGNLGSDAEVRVMDSGQAAISFSVGVTERWTDRQGVKQERTDWFRCTYWKPSDKTAIAQYLKKGTKVLIEGKASARAWTGQDGSVNASLELNVQNIEFLSAVQQPQAGVGSTVTPTHVNGVPVNNTPAQNKAAIEQRLGVTPPAAGAVMNTSEKIAAATADGGDDDLPF